MYLFRNHWFSGNAGKSAFCLALTLSLMALAAISAPPASAQDCILNSHQFAYVADQKSGKVSGYALNPSNGNLSSVPGSPFLTGKSGPAAVAVDPTGRFLYVAKRFPAENNVVGYAIECASGRLTPLPGSPFTAGEQPSSIAIDPSGNFVYVANLASNTISAYKIDATSGRLTPLSNAGYPTESSPAAIAVDPQGMFVYVANEQSGNVSGYTIDPTSGALTAITGSPFPVGTTPISVAVDPNQRFVYVANQGSSNISGFTINATTGALTPVSPTPFAAGSGGVYSITVDPSGNNLYAAANGGVFVYSINQNSEDFSTSSFPPQDLYGQLTLQPGSPFGGSAPIFVTVDYTGRFLYAANKAANNIAVFALGAGVPTPNAASPLPGGSAPVSVALVRPRTLPIFTATEIPEALGFGSVSSISATAINDLGEVSGTVAFYPSTGEFFQEAFLYAGGTTTGVAFSRISSGYDLNRSGQVVGQQDVAPPSPLQPPKQAFVYTPSSHTLVDIDNVQGRQSAAFGINNSGQVTGLLSTGTCIPPFAVLPGCLGATHAFLSSGSGLVDIGTLGGTFSEGLSINNRGQVAGISAVANGTASHLFRYTQGYMQDLGASPEGGVGSAVINDRGDILTGPYLYRRNAFEKLPINGVALNNIGIIVGSSDVPSGGTHAFVYFDGFSIDLNDLVDPSVTLLTYASGISNNGKIVAKGLNGHLYVLIPK